MPRNRRKPEPESAGRPTGSASRQQKHDRQGVQSGNPALDRQDAGAQPVREAERSYRNRPAKHR